MNALTKVKPDDILTFLPGIEAEEYEARAMLRSLRNASTAMIAKTDSASARCLAWMANEYATGALYAPGAVEALPNLNKLCKRLMLTAMQVEIIDLERWAE